MFNGIRTPHEGILEESILNRASERYGFVFVDDDSEVIQQKYEELFRKSQQSKLRHTPTIKKSEVLEFLFESERDCINQVFDQVFYIDPMSYYDMEETREEICDNIIEVFDECILFTPKVLVDSFPRLPRSVADYFVEKLVEHDIIIRVCDQTHSVDCNYPVGCKEEVLTVSTRISDEPYEVRLRGVFQESSSGGIISSELENKICAGVSDSLITFLEESGLLIETEYGYLVPSEIDNFVDYLAHEISYEIDMVLQDNDYIMLEDNFDETVQKTLADEVDLQDLSKSIEGDIFLKVLAELNSQLGLHRLKTDNGFDIIVSHRFDYFVSNIAEYTVTQVASDLEQRDENQTTLEGLLRDQIPDFSGNEVVADYYEQAVLEECKEYIEDDSDVDIW